MRKNIKKRLLYMVALILAGITNSAFMYGQKSDLDKLQGKTWQSKWYDTKNTYTRTTKTTIDSNGAFSMSFYLSNTPDTLFDYSKVGAVENGKYFIEEGYHGPKDVYVFEIVTLTDTEFTVRIAGGVSLSIHRALETFTMKYVLDKTLMEPLPFSPTKTTGFLADYNFPVNSKTIPDKLYKNVQLTQFTDNTSAVRGRFFRKFAMGSYTIVAVTFGDDLTYNRTDVLCVVDSNGNILDMLEGWVTVEGVTVKQYSISSTGVTVQWVAPSTSTSLSFENVTDFLGRNYTQSYNLSGGKFVSGTVYGSSEKTFTIARLSDPNVEIGSY